MPGQNSNNNIIAAYRTAKNVRLVIKGYSLGLRNALNGVCICLWIVFVHKSFWGFGQYWKQAYSSWAVGFCFRKLQKFLFLSSRHFGTFWNAMALHFLLFWLLDWDLKTFSDWLIVCGSVYLVTFQSTDTTCCCLVNGAIWNI